MTEQYKKEIFQYLATPENYTAAKEVANLLPQFEAFLQADFWEKLEKHLTELVNSDADFCLDLKNPWGYFILLDKSKYIGIHLSKGTNNANSYLSLGIFGKDGYDTSKANTIKEKYKNESFWFQGENQYWFTTESYPLQVSLIRQFREKKDYTNIVNENAREEMAKEIAENLWQYAKDSKEICKELLITQVAN
jgi:hypothetical protein